MAATRLAVREASRRAGPDVPLHVVGYSNGGALAVKYALDGLDDKSLSKVDRIVLLSPMIGVTRFARFSGLAGWPAVFPPFVKAAWLSILPEYNPFKYNSFPVNAATQTHRLTRALQAGIKAAVRQGRIGALPPILTFQSAVDFTVSSRAVVTALYDQLADNGSELVLFDINRAATVGILLRHSADVAVERLLTPAPRKYRTSVIGNAGPGDPAAVARVVAPGSAAETVRPLGIDYPRDVFSMSHIALPFPPFDGLYGSAPDPEDDFGVALGDIAARGETGVLIVGLDTLLRNSSNPFYAYVAERIEEGIVPR
jgi:alpha-beta hydrolase superfamily lysophospholipase